MTCGYRHGSFPPLFALAHPSTVARSTTAFLAAYRPLQHRGLAVVPEASRRARQGPAQSGKARSPAPCTAGLSPASVFSTTFRYGLISLLELAAADELLQAGTIAARHQLSQHYLSVVLADLRRLGLVHSQKGKNGGYRLVCQPCEVNLLFLYRALAGSAAADASLLDRDAHAADGNPAVGAPAHAADAWLLAVSRRWSAELEATSLADLQAWRGLARGSDLI